MIVMSKRKRSMTRKENCSWEEAKGKCYEEVKKCTKENKISMIRWISISAERPFKGDILIFLNITFPIASGTKH
jgi:hypothetical protein